jgi:hypothetical protein
MMPGGAVGAAIISCASASGSIWIDLGAGLTCRHTALAAVAAAECAKHRSSLINDGVQCEAGVDIRLKAECIRLIMIKLILPHHGTAAVETTFPDGLLQKDFINGFVFTDRMFQTGQGAASQGAA